MTTLDYSQTPQQDHSITSRLVALLSCWVGGPDLRAVISDPVSLPLQEHLRESPSLTVPPVAGVQKSPEIQ
jgi:hypothetical protein